MLAVSARIAVAESFGILFASCRNKPPLVKVLIIDSSLAIAIKDRRANQTTHDSGAAAKLARRCQRDLQDHTRRARLVCT